MKGLTISATGSTVTVGGLPTDGSVQSLAVSIQIPQGSHKKTILWGTIDRSDLTSPEQVFDLVTELNPADKAIVPDFNPAGFTATVFIRTIDGGKKSDPKKESSETDIDIDAATVAAILAQHPSIPAKAPAAPAPAPSGGKGGKGGKGGPTPTPAPGPHAPTPPGGGGGGHGPGGNAGGGGPVYPPVYPPAYPPVIPPVYPPHAPITISHPPQPADHGKFYIVIAVIIAVTILGGIIAWMVYKTPAVVTVSVQQKVIDTRVDTSRRNDPLQLRTRDIPAAPADKPMLASNGPKEINTVIGELPPLPAAKPVQTTIAQRVVAAPVYDSYGYNGSAVSSYGVSYHAGGSSTYAAPVTYSRQPPIDVTRVHTVRGNGYVLTSSPAFGISPDLVGAGNNYRVVASYRENRSGRRN